MVTCSLFSIFDPGCKLIVFGLSFKWLTVLFVYSFIWQYWISFSGFMVFYYLILSFVKLSVNSVFGYKYKKFYLISLCLLISLLLAGELGMIPFSFTTSSHLAYNMALSIPMWLSGLLFLMVNRFSQGMSHLTPLGCPMPLVPFLVMIESVSLIIRPFSLAIRLMANTMAGHMVMVLISSTMNISSFIYMLPILMGFMFFEFGIVMVQSYVFTSLLCMYYMESD